MRRARPIAWQYGSGIVPRRGQPGDRAGSRHPRGKDDLAEVGKTNIAKARKLKQSLMQELLTGRIRLV